MNEMIRQHENSCKLLEINTWMGKFITLLIPLFHLHLCIHLKKTHRIGKFYHGNLVEPGRNFIKAGSVLKVKYLNEFKMERKLYNYCLNVFMAFSLQPPTTMLHHSLTSNNQFYLVLLSDQIVSCKIKSELGSKGCLQPSLVLPVS